MIKYLPLLLTLILTSCASQPSAEISFLSYNVRNCIGLDGQTDYTRVADIIRNSKADVVALQELDSVTQRSHGTYVLGELAKLTGMYATFAPAIDFSGGKYGIGILSKEQPINTRAVALPGREEARALLVAEFEDYLFCATHFSLTPQDQLASATIIKDLFKDIKKPIFLAGDMNSTPGDSTQSALTSHFTALTDTTLFTHPANTPNVCIDYIYINKAHSDRFEVTKQAVIADSVASDHRPVQVVIRSKK